MRYDDPKGLQEKYLDKVCLRKGGSMIIKIFSFLGNKIIGNLPEEKKQEAVYLLGKLVSLFAEGLGKGLGENIKHN